MRRGDRGYASTRNGVAMEPIKPIHATKADRITPLVHDNSVCLVRLAPGLIQDEEARGPSSELVPLHGPHCNRSESAISRRLTYPRWMCVQIPARKSPSLQVVTFFRTRQRRGVTVLNWRFSWLNNYLNDARCIHGPLSQLTPEYCGGQCSVTPD